ncbi:MAG: TPM domain-containing protein [Chthoniobacterales bacterium]|nr:TPM domain-containing protein [Chthoniobacterales bacterium]
MIVSVLRADNTLPPPPVHYFNDAVGLVSPAVATQLDQELKSFDRKTSTQIVVWIAPGLPTNSSLDDNAQRLYTAWHLGTKKLSNGVLLLVVPTTHQIRIQTGYGLEGALPDALCKRIIDDVMGPAFQRGDYNQGMTAGVAAIMKATAGEYQASPLRKKKAPPTWQRIFFSPFGLFLLMIIIPSLLRWRSRRQGLENSGGGWFLGGFGGGMGGGSAGDDDWGGFSGGGGDSGGGGAGGGW